MRSTAAVLKIEEAVTVGLTCLEQGLDSKETVKNNILRAVSQNSIPIREKNTLENLPVSIFNLIHEYFGIGFEVQAGKITGAYMEGNEFRPTRKVNLERVLGLLRRNGVIFGSVVDAGEYITTAKGGEK